MFAIRGHKIVSKGNKMHLRLKTIHLFFFFWILFDCSLKHHSPYAIVLIVFPQGLKSPLPSMLDLTAWFCAGRSPWDAVSSCVCVSHPSCGPRMALHSTPPSISPLALMVYWILLLG